MKKLLLVGLCFFLILKSSLIVDAVSSVKSKVKFDEEQSEELFLAFYLVENNIKPTVRLTFFEPFLSAIVLQLCTIEGVDCKLFPYFNEPNKFYGKLLSKELLLFLSPADLKRVLELLKTENIKEKSNRNILLSKSLSNLAFFPLFQFLNELSLKADPLGFLIYLQESIFKVLTASKINFSGYLPKTFSKNFYLFRFGCNKSILENLDRRFLEKWEQIAEKETKNFQNLSLLRYELINPLKLEQQKERKKYYFLIALILLILLVFSYFLKNFKTIRLLFSAILLIMLCLLLVIKSSFLFPDKKARKTLEIFNKLKTESGSELVPVFLEKKIGSKEEGLLLSERFQEDLFISRKDSNIASLDLPSLFLPSEKKKRKNLEILPQFFEEAFIEEIITVLEEINPSKEEDLTLKNHFELLKYVKTLAYFLEIKNRPANETVSFNNYPAEYRKNLDRFFVLRNGQLFLRFSLSFRNNSSENEKNDLLSDLKKY